MTDSKPTDRDRQGFSREFRENLPPRTAIVDRGEPPASESALLRWPMTTEERAAFHRSITRITGELRDASEEDLERMLTDINANTRRFARPGEDLTVHTEAEEW